MLIYVTCGSEAEAGIISNGLIENRLAACVNIAEIRSVYEWKGKIENESEKLLIIKSVESKFTELERFIKANHSYDCPEIIGMEIKAVSKEYSDWVKSACKNK